jgi:hypothetical protein
MIRFEAAPLIPALPRHGERELSVRAGLLTRPAGMLNGLDPMAQACFLALARGEARLKGDLDRQDRLSIGCLACESDWRATWGALTKLGLITYKQSLTRADRSERLAIVTYWVTLLGIQAYKDFLLWKSELALAVEADVSEAHDEDRRVSRNPRHIR